MRSERLHSLLLRLMSFEASVKCTTRLEGNGSVSFLKRYPQLKVKETVTNLSIAQANATRKSSVLAWYKKYENVLKQLEITDPKYIWNIDEHGSEDMPKVKKVIGLKGIKKFQKQPHEKPK